MRAQRTSKRPGLQLIATSGAAVAPRPDLVGRGVVRTCAEPISRPAMCASSERTEATPAHEAHVNGNATCTVKLCELGIPLKLNT